MNIGRWALPLFKSAGLVPKSSKTIARSRIKCASCEICSYHLRLNLQTSPHLLKTCTSVTPAAVPTTGNACLKQAAATPLKGKLLMAMIHGAWACPACINLSQKRKTVSTFRKKRLWKSYGTQPGSQKNYKTRVKASSRASIRLKSISPHKTYLSMHQMNT